MKAMLIQHYGNGTEERYLNYEQREYPSGLFESLYDNLRKWGKYETIIREEIINTLLKKVKKRNVIIRIFNWTKIRTRYYNRRIKKTLYMN